MPSYQSVKYRSMCVVGCPFWGQCLEGRCLLSPSSCNVVGSKQPVYIIQTANPAGNNEADNLTVKEKEEKD